MNSFEKIQPAKPESLDAHWYERFEKIGSFQANEYLDGDKLHREEEQRKFISGEIINPDLDYPEINSDKLASDEGALLQLKKDILNQESNETVKQIYRWKLNEKIAELRMLKATESGDMKRFKKYSEFVYGKPSPEVFAYTVNNLKEKATSKLSSKKPGLSQAAQELHELLPANLPTAEYKLPEEAAISQAREQTLEELQHLLPTEKVADAEYGPEEIREVFQAALESLQAEGWNIVVSNSSKTGISVDQEHKLIDIPESRKLAFSKLESLVAHEIGTHVARRLNGERSQLQLLGLGLDRYEQGEEGIATMREQVLDDKIKDFSGLEGHLAVSLATGVDGVERDFREVYSILEKYFYFKSLLAGKSPEEALTSAQTNAWKRSVRTFRGTDCETKGTCLTKDMIYREGNIGVWDVINKNKSELMRFNVGKYDPANPRHIWILDQLGISESDLEELEK